MPELVVATGDGGRTRVRDIRRFWHDVQAPPSLVKRLEPAYYVFITLAIRRTVRLRDGERGAVGGRDAARRWDLGAVAGARRAAGHGALGRRPGPSGLQRRRHRAVA